MVFPLNLPLDPTQCAVTFQAWDKDIVTADDHIAEADCNFAEEALEAFTYDKSAKVDIQLSFKFCLSIQIETEQ